MFTDAYQTTALKSYRDSVEGIKKEIKISANLNEESPFRLEEFGLGKPVMALTGPDRDIPTFSHPIVMHGRTIGFFDDTVVFDARGFVRVALDGTITIIQPDEFNFHALRARLTRYVDKNHMANLAAVGTFPLQVFVYWLGETLTRRFAIDPKAQQATMAIIAIYYLSLFKDENELLHLNETAMARNIQTINRLFRIDAELLLQLFKTLPPLTDMTSLVKALKEHGGTERFEYLNNGLLCTIIGASWFGSQSKEILAVALEHPPTWISLVATVLTSQIYRKTDLAKLADRVNKQDAGADYLRGLLKLPGLKG